MATTATRTILDVVTSALRKARIVGVNQDPSAWDAKAAMEELDDMIKEWQMSGLNLWAWTSTTQALTTGIEYTLSPARPISIVNMRYTNASGVETPMMPLTRWGYDAISDKTDTGTPSMFYYDRQREDAKLYIWPALASATTEELAYTYQREAEDITNLNETLDMPGEWWATVVYNLAARLVDTYGLDNPTVQARAEQMYARSIERERDGSVFFRARSAGA